MGTSADATGGKGGDWTPLKRAAYSYARAAARGDGGDRRRAERVLARHVPLLGGASGAAGSAVAGRGAMQRLAGVLSGIGGPGLGPTLAAAGLQRFIGLDRFEVLDALMTMVAGDGADVEAQAARDTACDVFDELFGDAESWDELDEAPVTREDMERLLESFLASYVYNRIPIVAERLNRLTDSDAVARADQEMRSIIRDLVAIGLPEDPIAFDWNGPDGAGVVEDAIANVYEALEKLE
jgi:hypothetical protein